MWIGLINEEADKVAACKHAMEKAESGALQIWTSALTYAEVFKRKCAGVAVSIDAKDDELFEGLLEQHYVVLSQVDSDVGKVARRLLRKFAELKKPQDAVHLATAVLANVDEFHTFDEANLIVLDGKVERLDGAKLKICRPPEPPKPSMGPLFDDKAEEAKKATGAGGGR